MTRHLTPAQLQRVAAAQAPLDYEARADLRRNRSVEKICRLGPRVVGELLNVIGAKCSAGTLIDQEVERFSQLDPADVAALGGDRFPPAPLTLIRGGRDDGAPVRIGGSPVTKGNGITKDNRKGEK